MPLVTGKTVYILGAGTSHHCNIPLLNDFLVRARSLWQRDSDLDHFDKFETFFEWLDQLRAPAYYLNMNLENLEHVFSIIASMKELEYSGFDGVSPEELYESLSWVIYETIEKSCELKYKNQAMPDDDYNNFMRELTKIHEEKSDELTPQKKRAVDFRDSIITLNYDPMLDYALYFKQEEYGGLDYCTRDGYSSGDWKLLKLHGSLNWGVHRDCPDGQEHDPVKICDPAPSDNVAHISSDLTEIPFRIVSNRLSLSNCSSCDEKDVLTPLVMPPIWSKTPDHPVFKNVWKQAIEEIKNAFQIVIIGYSMPETDTFLPYLLSLGLAENPGLYRVIIVNPKDSEDLRDRYKSVFSKSMLERGDIEFLTTDERSHHGDQHVPMTFNQFIGGMTDFVKEYS